MSVQMVIELQEEHQAQTVIKALDAYKQQLKANIARTKRRLQSFERQYGVSTDHFLLTMAAEDLDGGDVEYVSWAGEAQLLAGLVSELNELEHTNYELR